MSTKDENENENEKETENEGRRTTWGGAQCMTRSTVARLLRVALALSRGPGSKIRRATEELVARGKEPYLVQSCVQKENSH